MRSRTVISGVASAAAAVLALTVLGPSSAGAAPAPVAAPTPGVTVYLCAVPYQGAAVSSGSAVTGNPFDPAFTNTAPCVGHIAELTGLSLDTMQMLNLGSQSTGAGAGKITFNPVTFTLPIGPFATALFANQASGTPFQSVFIAFRRNGQAGPTFFSLRLALAAVKTLALSTAGMQIGMEYGGLQMVSHTESGKTLGPPVVSGWNRVKNASFTQLDGNIQ
jgi:type VI protein secretion system component Hcp